MKMLQQNNILESCTGCGLCKELCNSDAISFFSSSWGFIYPRIDQNKCTQCNRCQKNCIVNNHIFTSPSGQYYYIAQHLNKDVLLSSSSGGAFSALANTLFEMNGVVYGAAFDKNSHVNHIRIESSEDIHKLQGSKYIQSNISSIFNDIILDLENERSVLFSGTPCQCAAIKTFCLTRKIKTDNLFLCDLICHGVSSPLIWDNYLEWIKNKVGSILSINMRDKKLGKGYQMCIQGHNRTYVRHGVDDPFLSLFSQNLILRPSCNGCVFKQINRVGDITIGDFQKAKRFYPEYYENGSSVLIIKTPNGVRLFEKAKKDLRYESVDQEKAMQININGGVRFDNDKINLFYSLYLKRGFAYVLKKYTTLGFKNNCFFILKKNAKKVLNKE